MKNQERRVDVIIAAGGSGTRLGAPINKVLLPWQGRPMLLSSIALFAACPEVGRIVIPARPQDREEIRRLISKWQAEEAPEVLPEIIITEGGRERQDSIYRGLACCEADWVLIHDGARPCATRAMIQACLEALETYPAVTAGVPSKDTIKIVNEAGEVIQTTERSRTYLVQTPQGFWRLALQKAHEAFRGRAVTDDCALMELAGYTVKIVPGAYSNIKITTPEDMPEK